MAFSVRLPYQRLANKGFSLYPDDILESYRSIAGSMTWWKFRRIPLRRRFGVRVPGLHRFLRRRARLVAAFRKVLKRLKESRSHFGDLFSRNYLFLQSNAFPFTTLKDEALWRDETWLLDLLVDGIDQSILNWVREGKYIFLYGRDDIEWIRKFTTVARQVAQVAKIPLEMVYLGKSSKREQVQRAIATITGEKLSSTWQDLTMIWFFWTRLESMMFWKIHLGKADRHDPVMQQIKKLLSYYKPGGWAVLSKGLSMVVNGHWTTVLPEYDLWKVQVGLNGYDVAFKEHHDRIQGGAQPCSRF